MTRLLQDSLARLVGDEGGGKQAILLLLHLFSVLLSMECVTLFFITLSILNNYVFMTPVPVNLYRVFILTCLCV